VVDAFLRDATYLIHDRDPLFTEAFEARVAPRLSPSEGVGRIAISDVW
jgi:hypothetical protein